ncbi:MAG: hypothetical protein V4608_05405 [Bacteroidota bacterium]
MVLKKKAITAMKVLPEQPPVNVSKESCIVLHSQMDEELKKTLANYPIFQGYDIDKVLEAVKSRFKKEKLNI